jgi:hypothetical protein
MPPLLQLLLAPGEPMTHAMAIGGILVVSLAALALAGYWIPKLEINYSTD